VDGSGRGATLLGEPGTPPSPGERLRWALPHLLWLSGGAVLHASAVRFGGAVLALTGASGSGKSTLARLLSGGVDPISDDLLVLRSGPAGLEAVLGGEAAARAWEAREAPRLAGGREARLEEGDLAVLTAGPTLPLAAIWLLDASRREGNRIALESTAGAEGLGLLLEQSFGETGAPEVWRRIFETSARLVEAVPILRASVPGTLTLLDGAAQLYRANVAS
jgi:energy-coupling factor transporter ATP-binding protein EcfA2